MCVCVCVCVFVLVCVSGCAVAIDGAVNAVRDMVETAQQLARWWILATGVKFTGFWEVNMYNILDFWKVNKEMVRETNMNEVNLHTPHLGSSIQY